MPSLTLPLRWQKSSAMMSCWKMKRARPSMTLPPTFMHTCMQVHASFRDCVWWCLLGDEAHGAAACLACLSAVGGGACNPALPCHRPCHAALQQPLPALCEANEPRQTTPQ